MEINNLKVEFSANQTKRIMSMANIQNIAETELIKRALALYDLVLKEQYGGNNLSISKDNQIIKNIRI